MKKSIKSLFQNNVLKSRYIVKDNNGRVIGPGLIYFAQGGVTGMIRISQCRNIQSHFANLKKECSEDLTIIGKILGELKDKNELFIEFAHLRAHDDWFHMSPELIEFIKSFEE